MGMGGIGSGPLHPQEAGVPEKGKEGLGATGHKSKIEIAAFDIGGGKFVYGSKKGESIKRLSFDPLGNTSVTSENVPWYLSMKPIIRWKGVAKGIAEFSFPHPKGWTFKELLKEVPIDRLDVRMLTGAFSKEFRGEPKAVKRHGMTLDLHGISQQR